MIIIADCSKFTINILNKKIKKNAFKKNPLFAFK